MNQVRLHRRHPRGMTLLVALGTLAVVTAATLVSLRIVSQESELQGGERRTREAFFAAEAGLAEGREVLTTLLGNGANNNNFNAVMAQLGDLYSAGQGLDGVVNEPDFPGNGWYEVIPQSRYSLLAGAGQAVDPNVATPMREMRDPNGRTYISFPEQSTVFYRVFMHDDDDDKDEPGNPNDGRRDDTNSSVWLVSMGEVQGKGGVVLARSVVRVLVSAGLSSQVASGYGGQKLGGSDKTSGTSLDTSPPNIAQGTTF
ncbi:hypothetical protein [Archangium lipolyticum]|uniref:hypothetical protein n=1 Tax=Archangium lipolyticum TaxID=2970465 RepID=UPI00214A8069|nr:hypothetical protein [Archangium lipolyticum]